jgi:hypothetical protein
MTSSNNKKKKNLDTFFFSVLILGKANENKT